MNVGVNSESHCGIPIHFLWGNKQFIKKRSVLSELKGNFTYNQACSLMNANPSTNIGFKLLTVSESDYAICVI